MATKPTKKEIIALGEKVIALVTQMKSATEQLMPRIPSNLIIMEYGAYALGFNEAKAAFIQLCDDVINAKMSPEEQEPK